MWRLLRRLYDQFAAARTRHSALSRRRKMTGNLDPKTLYDFITGDFEDAWNAIAGVAGAAVHRGNFMFGRQAMSLRPSASSPKLRMEERPHTAAIEGDVAECSESNADGGTGGSPGLAPLALARLPGARDRNLVGHHRNRVTSAGFVLGSTARRAH